MNKVRVSFLLVLCAFCAAVSALDNADTSISAFNRFTQQYGKEYSTEQEKFRRYQIFKQNVIKAQKLSEKSPKAHYGVTKFSDMTEEEFRYQYFLKYPLPLKNSPRDPQQQSNSYPPQFDWNSKGKVTAVKNEGQCGSSIAYSVVESVESCWATAGHTLVDLSIEQMVMCGEGGSCDGGWFYYDDWNYALLHGLTEEGGFKNNCKQAPVAKISKWVNVTESSEAVMQAWLYSNAPVSVCVDAANWQLYNGGIMTAGECGSEIDTCVQVTGWLTANGTLAWNVRNDWGDDWGNNGYIWVQMGSNACGIANYVTGCIGQ